MAICLKKKMCSCLKMFLKVPVDLIYERYKMDLMRSQRNAFILKQNLNLQ